MNAHENTTDGTSGTRDNDTVVVVNLSDPACIHLCVYNTATSHIVHYETLTTPRSARHGVSAHEIANFARTVVHTAVERGVPVVMDAETEKKMSRTARKKTAWRNSVFLSELFHLCRLYDVARRESTVPHSDTTCSRCKHESAVTNRHKITSCSDCGAQVDYYINTCVLVGDVVAQHGGAAL